MKSPSLKSEKLTSQMESSPPKWKWFGAGAPQILHKQLSAGGDRWGNFGFITTGNLSRAICKSDFFERGLKVELSPVQFLKVQLSVHFLQVAVDTVLLDGTQYRNRYRINLRFKMFSERENDWKSHFNFWIGCLIRVLVRVFDKSTFHAFSTMIVLPHF